MKRLACAVLLLLGIPHARADLPRLLLIARSTAPAPLGQHATLTVNPLKLRGDRFVGAYTMTVAPIPLANETGSLEVRLPPGALHSQQPVAFEGSATNDAGKPRSIKGVAKPDGTVHLEIHSERGKLQFDTTYRLP